MVGMKTWEAAKKKKGDKGISASRRHLRKQRIFFDKSFVGWTFLNLYSFWHSHFIGIHNVLLALYLPSLAPSIYPSRNICNSLLFEISGFAKVNVCILVNLADNPTSKKWELDSRVVCSTFCLPKWSAHYSSSFPVILRSLPFSIKHVCMYLLLFPYS